MSDQPKFRISTAGIGRRSIRPVRLNSLGINKVRTDERLLLSQEDLLHGFGGRVEVG
jgi:hypothetical protein